MLVRRDRRGPRGAGLWEACLLIAIAVQLGLGPWAEARAADDDDAADVVLAERFTAVGSDGLPEGWRLLTFRNVSRVTSYRVIADNGRGRLLAESEEAAAALVRPLGVDPRRFPSLSWYWRIERPLPPADAQTKAGDDYAARVYVTFGAAGAASGLGERLKRAVLRRLYGVDPPAASINYVWGSGVSRGKRYRSPYTDASAIVVLRDATDGTEVWCPELRNVARDYAESFGEPVPPIVGIAVMTDADNIRAAAAASYADLVLRAQAARPHAACAPTLPSPKR